MEILERLIALFTLVLLFAVGLLLAIVAPTYADPPIISPADTNQPVFPSNPLITPADGSTVATFTPIFDWADASDPEGSTISYTLMITTSASPTTTTSVIITSSTYTPVFALPNGSYTWTVQAQDEAGNVSSEVAPNIFTITVAANSEFYLPIVLKPETPVCPISS
ncbi:MAG TPA: Ig-like domain-containing protein, partial [Anaerolineae bacterium]|nr:Ig-like domain-containing protein [Anaerolineae bacterium]